MSAAMMCGAARFNPEAVRLNGRSRASYGSFTTLQLLTVGGTPLPGKKTSARRRLLLEEGPTRASNTTVESKGGGGGRSKGTQVATLQVDDDVTLTLSDRAMSPRP